jgi:hypothetical protein
LNKWVDEMNRQFSKEEIQMATKHMKKRSTSLAMKEMQTNIEISLHSNQNGCHQGHKQQQMLARMWEKGTLIHCWWECKLGQPLWKTVWRLPKNLKINLPYNPAVSLLGTYPEECKSGYTRGTCTPMFTAALVTIANLWKQPRCCNNCLTESYPTSQGFQPSTAH